MTDTKKPQKPITEHPFAKSSTDARIEYMERHLLLDTPRLIAFLSNFVFLIAVILWFFSFISAAAFVSASAVSLIGMNVGFSKLSKIARSLF
ncbi:MAG: hypothetical protein ABJ360_22625 [Roseobacter sp.]